MRSIGRFVSLVALCCAFVVAAPLTFVPLTGVVGGSPAATGVYKADLSTAGIGSILGLIIQDNSAGLGGSPGQFSGFDLDAVKISTTNCADAACAAAAPALAVFDFVGGVFFTPGTQRVPVDPKLFGTGPAGNTVDNTVATLALFDGNSTTAIPGAFGFISMGDNGALFFNLTAPVTTTGAFLYIGEVGDNGEVAASSIRVTQDPAVPEPGSFILLGAGLAALAIRRVKHS